MTGFILGAVLATIVGICVGLQAATNHALRTELSMGAMLMINSIIVLAAAMIYGAFDGGSYRAMLDTPSVPWQQLVGGFYGFSIILFAPIVVQRMGATNGLAIIMAAQILTGVVIDHLGAFGLERAPFSLSRLGGVALILLGVLLTRR
jgi:bacterial/archaeal transporter family-2 protein